MQAPDFALYDMFSENQVSLTDYKGKALLLTFWVSWCPDSRKDIANKEQLYRSMQSDDADLLMIHVSGREHQAGAAETYYQENGLTLPVVKDDGTAMYDAYRCMSVPTTFILDKHHRIASSFNDKASFHQIVAALGNVLAG